MLVRFASGIVNKAEMFVAALFIAERTGAIPQQNRLGNFGTSKGHVSWGAPALLKSPRWPRVDRKIPTRTKPLNKKDG